MMLIILIRKVHRIFKGKIKMINSLPSPLIKQIKNKKNEIDVV